MLGVLKALVLRALEALEVEALEAGPWSSDWLGWGSLGGLGRLVLIG